MNKERQPSCLYKARLVKLILALLLIVLAFQVAQFCIYIDTWNSYKMMLRDYKPLRYAQPATTPPDYYERVSPTLSPKQQLASRKHIVLYSYYGIRDLPQAQEIFETFNTHPEVFFLPDPTKFLTEAKTLVRTSVNKRRIEQLQNCDKALLDRLGLALSYDPSVALQSAVLGRFCRNSEDCRAISQANLSHYCSKRKYSVLDIRSHSDLRLDSIVNGSSRLIHIVADPRLILLSWWWSQPKHKELKSISPQNIPKLQQFVENYCRGLKRDYSVVQKLKQSLGERIKQKYFLLRYEDFFSSPFSAAREFLNFSQLHLTEKQRESMAENEQEININEFYASVPTTLKAIADEQCRGIMQLLGYVDTQRSSTSNKYVEKLDPWWS